MMAASALVATLLICAVLGVSVVGYLSLISQQNALSMRSQAWNMAIAVVEAGIEEGLEHLNADHADLATYGWELANGVYTRSNTLPDGNNYVVTIDVTTDPNHPSIVSRAYMTSLALAQSAPAVFFADIGSQPVSLPPVTRAVRVTCKKGSLFLAALVARGTVNLNGNGIITDSFDSSDPNYSTNGQYDPTKVKDAGDVASNEGIISAVDAGNANIYGRVHTGPGGTVALGPNGAIGSHAWQAGHTGVEPGWFFDDANFTFPDTTFPNLTGYLEVPSEKTAVVEQDPSTGDYVTNYYDHVLSDGNYVADSLSGSTLITGKVTLVLNNGLNMGGSDSIKVAKSGSLLGGTPAQDASLTLYAGGTGESINGNAILNGAGRARDFVVYCAPSVTSLSLSGNGQFIGVLVAPNVDLHESGGGNDNLDFIGALMANSVTMNGHFSFHYDEDLQNLVGNGRYLISSWNEVR